MRARSLLVTTLMAALALTAVPAAATPATPPVTASSTCPTPPDPQPAPRFTDTTGSVHADSIDCVARWGIAQGTSATTYGPRRDVTRAQMATFVANLIRATATPLPAGPARFADTAGSPHAANIDALAAAGIINGLDARTYAPNRNVTRAQAATILAGTYRHLRGADLPEGRDRFRDDDGSPHEANINRLANANIINGRDATTFGHADPLKRDQMASLLARFLTQTTSGGTIYYADFTTRGVEGRYELVSFDAASPAERRVLHSVAGSTFHAVNPHRGEYAYTDLSFDGPAGEPRNLVSIRALADNEVRDSFRWGTQCAGRFPNEGRQLSAPLPSPDGRWFAAQARYGAPQYLDSVEIRDSSGGCQLRFGHQELADWAWTPTNDLLVVMDGDALPDVSADHVLAIVPRAQIAAEAITRVTVLEEYDGDHPTGLAISSDGDRIAYTYRDDLYVFDRQAGAHRRVAHSANTLVNPAFSPDGRTIIVRHRTFGDTGLYGSQGEVHVVPAQGGSSTQVASGGPTELKVPPRRGAPPAAFDALGQFVWAP